MAEANTTKDNAPSKADIGFIETLVKEALKELSCVPPEDRYDVFKQELVSLEARATRHLGREVKMHLDELYVGDDGRTCGLVSHNLVQSEDENKIELVDLAGERNKIWTVPTPDTKDVDISSFPQFLTKKQSISFWCELDKYTKTIKTSQGCNVRYEFDAHVVPSAIEAAAGTGEKEIVKITIEGSQQALDIMTTMSIGGKTVFVTFEKKPRSSN